MYDMIGYDRTGQGCDDMFELTNQPNPLFHNDDDDDSAFWERNGGMQRLLMRERFVHSGRHAGLVVHNGRTRGDSNISRDARRESKDSHSKLNPIN